MLIPLLVGQWYSWEAESTWKASFCFLFTAYFLLDVYYDNCTISFSSPKWHKVFLFSTHYVCLSGLYHTLHFQRLSSDNKSFTTRQLLKQGNIWPCTVNIKLFIRNGTKITLTWLPNTWHKQWKSRSDVQWGSLGAHPMGCQGTRVTSRNGVLHPPMLQLQTDHTPDLSLNFSSLEMKQEGKNNHFPCCRVTKMFGSFVTTSEIRISTL